ncbi:hypothetical protein HPB49_016304 [Dermacentor silvarum]|uniref:Uncharacterized protein n=1 Tax=Dermacentor silvarum TaxID=543639 RepID=A0ACB8E1G8_DERSI|nr:hypothetical protein HPB49_016304 [Dermacentor silvarum]
MDECLISHRKMSYGLNRESHSLFIAQGTQDDLERHETLESHMNFILTYTEKANGSMETLQQALTESTQQNLELQSSLNAIKEQMTDMLREQHNLQEQVRVLASRVHDGQQECQRMAVSGQTLPGSPYTFFFFITREASNITQVPELCYLDEPVKTLCSLNKLFLGQFSTYCILLQVMQGKFDCVLDWPCKYEHVLRVVDQTGRGMHLDRQHSFRSIPSKSKHLMGRPVNECNVPIGFHTMAPLSELHNERSGFIRNDTLVIVYRCRI